MERNHLPVEVRIVVSDVEQAGILELARNRGFRAEYIDPGAYRTKLDPEAEQRLVNLLREAGAEWVVLAGFMRMIKAPWLEASPAPRHQYSSFAPPGVSRIVCVGSGACRWCDRDRMYRPLRRFRYGYRRNHRPTTRARFFKRYP